MFKNLKISAKLTIGFSLIVLLITAGGYFFLNASQNTLQIFLGKSSAALAAEGLDKIDRVIYFRIEEIQSYAKDIILQGFVAKSNNEFEELKDPQSYIRQKDEEWVSAPAKEITSFMRQLMENDLSRELRDKTRFYEEKYGYKVFSEIFVTNKYGVIAGLTGKTTDYFQADERWYQAAKEDGKFWVSDVEYDSSADVFALDIAVCAYDENREFIGIIKAVLNVEEVVKAVGELEKSAAKIPGHTKHKIMHFTLVNKDGKIIYSTEEFEFFKKMPFSVTSHCIDNGSFKKQDYFIAEGNLFSCAHSKGYRDYKGLKWVLLVKHRVREIFAPVIKLRNILLGASIVMIIFAALIGLFISYSIVDDLKSLRNAVSAFGRGELDKKVDIKNRGETGLLAAAFNQMADDLKKAVDSEKIKTRELAKIKKELEIRVAERTEDLEEKIYELEKNRKAMLYIIEDLNNNAKELKAAQERIIQSEKLAALGKLAGVVSHEMRNPLGIIGNAVYFLRTRLEKIKDEKVKKHLDILQLEVQKTGKIISDILEFGRIKKPVSKKAGINDVIKHNLSLVNIPKKVEVRLELEENLPKLLLDVSQMERVFPNIILNAVQAMPQGGELRISAARKEAFVEIIFKDSGIGIAKENLHKIFDPLFTTKAGGIGFGLAVCRAIIENHGGEIKVESEEGKGTSFIIKLPVTV